MEIYMSKRLENLWIWFDYGIFLPFLTLFPYKYGRYLAALRGYLYSLIKRDWRSFTFDDTSLWQRTYNSYKEICPHLSHNEHIKLVKKRYMHQSIEEYEGVLLDKDNFNHIQVTYIGLKNVEEQIAKNPHAVFVTAHFGSSLLGITFLNKLNIPLLVMSSNVVEHEKVHPTITNFFLKKYRGIDRYMNGGEVLDIEGNGKKFLNFLKKIGSLVIISDLPPNNANETPVFKMFFGQKRGFASGAQKLAKSTNSIIIPFVCYFEDNGFVMKFGDLEKDPYSFLEEEISVRPELWWASDLLEIYKKEEE
jgi:lauroyl/myristoyl acyltransferase